MLNISSVVMVSLDVLNLRQMSTVLQERTEYSVSVSFKQYFNKKIFQYSTKKEKIAKINVNSIKSCKFNDLHDTKTKFL